MIYCSSKIDASKNIRSWFSNENDLEPKWLFSVMKSIRPVTLQPHFGWKSWLRSLRMLEKGVVFFWEMLECIYLTYLILFSFFCFDLLWFGDDFGMLEKGWVITLLNGLKNGFYWGEISSYLQAPPFHSIYNWCFFSGPPCTQPTNQTKSTISDKR